MTAILGLSKKVMGKVHTTLTIVNRADQVSVENGFWSEEQIRSITLRQGLVDAKIYIYGEGTFECLELPGGQAPLEMLGLQPDLKNQALRVLPTESVDTYLTIL